MKRFLTTTAAVALLGAPAFADAHKTDADKMDKAMGSATFLDQTSFGDDTNGQLRGSNLIGKAVYVTEMDVRETEINTEEMEWDNIGDVNDILLSRNGGIEAILVDIGGFLGMGEKTVAVSMDQLTLVSGQDDGEEFYVVFKGNKETLESAAEFDTANIGTWAADTQTEEQAELEADEVKADQRAEATEAADEEIERTEAASISTDDAVTTSSASDMSKDDTALYQVAAPEITREGYDRVAMEQLTADDITGAVVYDTSDENIGEVSELLMTTEGQVEAAILDVGGFLGMGEKQVRVSLDSLTIKRAQDDADDVRVYVDATKDALMEEPEYEG